MEYSELQEVNESLKKTNIHGKGYIEVAQRVQAFRKLFGFSWRIDTTIDVIDEGKAAYATTSIIDPLGVIVSTGHAFEERAASMINKTSFIENAETSAVGRALGFLGIGSVDSIASAEEMASAPTPKPPVKPAPTPKTPAKRKAPAQAPKAPAKKPPSKASRDRLRKAVAEYAKRHERNAKDVSAGVMKRPDYEETDEFFALVASELEQA